MSPDYLTSTAIHEAAHAVASHLLGERFQYIELLGERDGLVMPYHSPCPLCDTEVGDGRSCHVCFEYFAKHDPAEDVHSREIDHVYRREAAIAAAGELAEKRFNGGTALATVAELDSDRLRVRTRASLRHLWADACTGYSGGGDDCPACPKASEELRNSVDRMLSEPKIRDAIQVLAEEVKDKKRISGDDVVSLLTKQSVEFASVSIDELWPPAS